MPDSLRPHGLQHIRFLCIPLPPGVCSNICPLNWWWYLTISSSAAPISFDSSLFQGHSLFQWLFISDGQNIGVSASVFPMNSQGYFPFSLNGWISLQSKGFSRVFSSTTVQKHQFSGTQFLYSAALTSVYDYWKTVVWLQGSLLANWCLCSLTGCLGLSELTYQGFFFVRAFPTKCLLISWILSPSAVLLELEKRQSVTASTFPVSICREVMRPDAIIFVFWMLTFKAAFSFSFLPVSRGSLVPIHFLPLEWYQLYFWGCWYFPSNLDYSLWFIQPGISHDVLCMEVK